MSKKSTAKPTGKMLQFVETEQDMPEKRDSNVRKDDFLEIYGDYIDVKAEEQASRYLWPYMSPRPPLRRILRD